jgi:putative transposase
MKSHRRKSTRLKEFDYSQAGEYFVTICTAQRACILGEVLNARMRLSVIGRIVEDCWTAIPTHFHQTCVDVFQIMPNHIHGIIKIVGRGEVSSPQTNARAFVSTKKGDETSPLHNVTLGKMVAYFKYQATKRINLRTSSPGRRVFQRNYYDHIIRDDIDHFFVEQYIELNPILWELDSDNPEGKPMPPEDLEKLLREEHDLTGSALQRVMEYEPRYRRWSGNINRS